MLLAAMHQKLKYRKEDTLLIFSSETAIRKPHHTPSRSVKRSFSASALLLGQQKVMTAETASVSHSIRLPCANVNALSSSAAGADHDARENIRR